MQNNDQKLSLNEKFSPFQKKMEVEGIPPLIINKFMAYYEKLLYGERGLLSRRDITPVEKDDIAHMHILNDYTKDGLIATGKTVIIKLNGGLGTSMGLLKAKSLIEVKKDLSFLDIIARQTLSYREQTGVEIPLILMNSFKTDEDSRKFLSKYPGLTSDIPLSFIQHKFPKVLKEDLSPAYWPKDPENEWNPPGHGDIYFALITSGMLDKLLEKGYIYAFISNSDNLGAILDYTILGYFASHNFPFMLEVADRTEADIKGGHLAKMKSGGLILREIAQCPDEELDEFQDISIYTYFNTNNIWINLKLLKENLHNVHNMLDLPMIVNEKKIDPRDDLSAEVYQIETAMGSAISVFENSTAIRVPRIRFAPVKKSQDLLALRSDCFVLTEDNRVIQNPERKIGEIVIELDENYYKKIDHLKKRFPYGAPSLINCESLKVVGDIYFGKDITIKGNVTILNHSEKEMIIPDGMVIHKDLLFE
jgi:UTP--glucose-1-phosphate uridylyltransferase